MCDGFSPLTKQDMVFVVRKELEMLQDKDYQAFHSKLLPGTANILGVRIPKLRKLAKDIIKDDWRSYLAAAPDTYYEETMLCGFIIGYAAMDFEERMAYIRDFLPHINNWAVCDCFCATLKFTKKYPKEVWDFIQGCFKSEEPYILRFACVMALDYYTMPEYADAVFQAMDAIKNPDYYVQMSIAWAVSIYYIKLPKQTEKYLKHNQLSDFTHNKAIQKICESYRVDKETKIYLKSLKRL